MQKVLIGFSLRIFCFFCLNYAFSNQQQYFETFFVSEPRWLHRKHLLCLWICDLYTSEFSFVAGSLASIKPPSTVSMHPSIAHLPVCPFVYKCILLLSTDPPHQCVQLSYHPSIHPPTHLASHPPIRPSIH